MPRKTTVNDETVGQAVDSLVQEGLDPTLERVRSKLGGGSYTTINRVLTAVLEGVRGLMEEKYTLENVCEFNRLLH